jgi:uncharacterized membrane protein YgcG
MPTSCESTPWLLNHLPSGTATTKQLVAARTLVATVLELSCRPIPTAPAQRPADHLKLATAEQPLTVIDRAVVPHREPGGGGSDGGSSNHRANRRTGGGGDHGGRGHANSHASGASQGGYDARQKIEELRRKKAST